MKKVRKQQEGFDDLDWQIKLPRRDYARMSEPQLWREGRRMYAGLQAIWHAELKLPDPEWQILESVSRQMKILEEGCPEVYEP
jgi:hypothetical protein